MFVYLKEKIILGKTASHYGSLLPFFRRNILNVFTKLRNFLFGITFEDPFIGRWVMIQAKAVTSCCFRPYRSFFKSTATVRADIF